MYRSMYLHINIYNQETGIERVAGVGWHERKLLIISVSPDESLIAPVFSWKTKNNIVTL